MKFFEGLPLLTTILSIILACSMLVENIYGQVNRYWVALNANHQMPPAVTEGKGYVGFKFSDDFDQVI
jgi:hypothetical protein